MGYRLILALAGLVTLAACGGGPTTPTPQPSSIAIHGTITDTVSGATIGSFDQAVAALPARVMVSAAGHLTRETTVTSAAPTVDLIPDAAPFDLGFYRQFARGTIDGRAPEPLRVLKQSPSMYLQRAGLSDANVAALEQAARDVIPALTGGVLSLAGWETGSETRAESVGWIVVELVNDDSNCGRANIGTVAGHIWLNIAAKCARGGLTIAARTFAHEVGHALGFAHVSDSAALMNAIVAVEQPSAAERYHGAIAYKRSAGNRDIDSD